MPFPVGHTLAGCAVALAVIPSDTPYSWGAWALCLASANLPDLDFVPGFIANKPMAYHRGPSHSPVAGVFAALLGASLLTWTSLPWLTGAALIFLAYLSHVGLDYFTAGGGVLFGWPFTYRAWRAHRSLFPRVTLGRTRQSFCLSLATRRVLWASLTEALLLGPGVALFAFARSFGLLPIDSFPF
ncbi:MAG: metal-dependent hydrolase [Candidatus Entotheonellia bacterium]